MSQSGPTLVCTGWWKLQPTTCNPKPKFGSWAPAQTKALLKPPPLCSYLKEARTPFSPEATAAVPHHDPLPEGKDRPNALLTQKVSVK